MHWTILSDYEVFDTKWQGAENASTASRTEEHQIGEALVLVQRSADGQATVSRLISPRASDYLRPEYQPGAPFYG